MPALQLIQALNNVLFGAIFVLVALSAFRQRSRASLDVALFFGALAVAVLLTPVLQILGVGATRIAGLVVTILVMSLPYLMLRLLAAFTNVPLLVRAATLGGLIAPLGVVLTDAPPLDPAATLFLLGYFAALALYTPFGFVSPTRPSSPVPHP